MTKRAEAFHPFSLLVRPTPSRSVFLFDSKRKYRDRDSVKWADGTDGTDEPKIGQVVVRRRLSCSLYSWYKRIFSSYIFLFLLLIRTF